MEGRKSARWLWVLAAAIAVVAGVPGAASARTNGTLAVSHRYDTPAVARVDVLPFKPAETSPTQLSDAREESAPLSVEARGTYTTPTGPVVATEAAGELANPSFVNNAGAPIRSFVTAADQTYVRVFSGDRNVGAFLTGSAPASADAAVAGLALPPTNTADFIQNVTVPAGTRLQSSIATKAFGQPGGMLQFELLDRIPTSCFGTGRPFR